jgi:hypothetical protein
MHNHHHLLLAGVAALLVFLRIGRRRVRLRRKEAATPQRELCL